MRIFEYRCRKCMAVFESLTTEEDRKNDKPCPNCEGFGRFIISAPHLKAWLDSDRWVKNRESHMRKEQRNIKNHGTYS